MDEQSSPLFDELGLPEFLLHSLKTLGYERPSPIQAQTIPQLMEGEDLLGQAQTGTGKTAAFALPLLANVDLELRKPQALILCPTRELAIQVAEALQRYASEMKGFHVLPIYGGTSYGLQLKQLKRGVHIVVGTPGRVMDHMDRGTLDLSELRTLVLDEADEMLRMGFIDDVEWILEHTPDTHQTALFSATMPKQIAKIAQRYLKEPVRVSIKAQENGATRIHQRYQLVPGHQKLEALTRLLEMEPIDGAILFVRTKMATIELAEKLEARGYAATALNGDIPQNQRERTVDQFKAGKIDILVATDVVARGLDVDRVSHVINYDIPHDTESYIHRIGRTGRAGRSGDAILFVTHRERHLLRTIEKATKKKIEQMEAPTVEAINEKRRSAFKARIQQTLEEKDCALFQQLVSEFQEESERPFSDIAAALALMVQGDQPLEVEELPQPKPRKDRKERKDRDSRARSDQDMECYRLEVGSTHGAKAGNIVGAIANEAGLDSKYIGKLKIFPTYTMVDLPGDMPNEIFKTLQRTRVAGQPLRLRKMGGKPKGGKRRPSFHKNKR